MPDRTLLYLGGPPEAPVRIWRRRGDGNTEMLFDGTWPSADSDAIAALRATPPQVIMPDHQGSLLWVEMPTRRREQAQRALPYALEEWVLDDPSRLHTTLGPSPQRSNEGWQWPVLLVDAAWRRELLEQLADLNIHPAALVHPLDIEPQPDEPGQWRVMLADQAAGPVRLVSGRHAGFVLPADDRTIEQRVAETITRLPETERPTRLRCDGCAQETVERLAALLSATSDEGIAVEPGPEPRRPATWFHALETTVPLSAVESRTARQGRQQRRGWATVVVLAIVLLAAVTGLRFAEGWQAARQADALEARIATDFRAALPDTRLVNPRVQIKQAVEQLNGGGAKEGGNAFLPLVAAMAEAMQGSAARLTRLDYQDDRLAADWEGPEYDRMQQAAEQLRGDPRVAVEHMDAAVEQNRARMQITLGRPEPGETQ